MSRVCLLVTTVETAANLSVKIGRLFDNWKSEGTAYPQKKDANGQLNPFYLTVSKGDTPENVKAQIDAAFAQFPTINHVFPFGNVPVPYCGAQAYDGHPEHITYWSNYGYYVTDGNWVRGSVPDGGNTQFRYSGFNAWGFPNPPKAAIGSVNLANMDAIGPEMSLLENYLDRRDEYSRNRGKQYGLYCLYNNVFDGNFDLNINLRLRQEMEQYFPGRFKYGNLQDLATNPAHFAVLFGPGWHVDNTAFGGTLDIKAIQPKALFVFAFASWIGDVQTPNNVCRALLATGSLYVVWDDWEQLDMSKLTQRMSVGEMWLADVRLSRNLAYDPQGDPTLTSDFPDFVTVSNMVTQQAAQIATLTGIVNTLQSSPATPSLDAATMAALNSKLADDAAKVIADQNTITALAARVATLEKVTTLPTQGTATPVIPPVTPPAIPVPAPPVGNANTSGVFTNTDASTQGNWIGKYGKDGQHIARTPDNIPLYIKFSSASVRAWSWSNDSSDPRNVQVPGGRVATCDYSEDSFSYDVQITDGGAHLVSLYLLDWDKFCGGRKQTVKILDAATLQVLDSKSVTGFDNGIHLNAVISGHVIIMVTNDFPGCNAVCSAVFFG